MKRRKFLSAGALLGMTPVMSAKGLAKTFVQPETDGVQYFEWIRYHLHVGKKQGLVSDFYRDVAIPAFNRAGIKNIGVFNVKHGENNPTLHVIIPHPTLDSIVSLNDRILADENFLRDGNRFLNAPLSDMVFVSMEKTILRAFIKFPGIQVPPQIESKTPRIYQVRRYEAPSLTALKRRVHMFNEGSIIDIFKKTGLQPVFFGETVAGNRMPSLMYMVAFDDMIAFNKTWDTFRADPAWAKLSNDPFYAETISCINDWIWTAAPFSQI